MLVFWCVVTFTPFGVCTCEKISREDERDEETISTTLLESDNYPVLSVSIKTFAHQLELGTGGSAWLHVFKPKEARQAQCETKPEATTRQNIHKVSADTAKCDNDSVHCC